MGGGYVFGVVLLKEIKKVISKHQLHKSNLSFPFACARFFSTNNFFSVQI